VRTALAVYERLEGLGSSDAALCLTVMGAVYGLQKRWGKVQAVFTRELDIRERVLGSDHPTTTQSLHNLAGTLEDLGELKRSQELRQRARSSHPAT
jgi:hypothetical protein